MCTVCHCGAFYNDDIDGFNWIEDGKQTTKTLFKQQHNDDNIKKIIETVKENGTTVNRCTNLNLYIYDICIYVDGWGSAKYISI